jgi:hypothetical protein
MRFRKIAAKSSGCMVFSFLQSDNQKKEEGYPIARKKKTMQPEDFAVRNLMM